jgi:hypothetical protein
MARRERSELSPAMIQLARTDGRGRATRRRRWWLFALLIVVLIGGLFASRVVNAMPAHIATHATGDRTAALSWAGSGGEVTHVRIQQGDTAAT